MSYEIEVPRSLFHLPDHPRLGRYMIGPGYGQFFGIPHEMQANMVYLHEKHFHEVLQGCLDYRPKMTKAFAAWASANCEGWVRPGLRLGHVYAIQPARPAGQYLACPMLTVLDCETETDAALCRLFFC